MAIACRDELPWKFVVKNESGRLYITSTDTNIANFIKSKYGWMEVNKHFIFNWRKKNGINSYTQGLKDNCTDLKRLHIACVTELNNMFGKPEPTGALEMQTVDVQDWEATKGDWEAAKERAFKRRTKVKNIVKKQDGQGITEFGLIIAAICSLILLF